MEEIKMSDYSVKHLSSRKFIERFGKMLVNSARLSALTGQNIDPLLALMLRGHIEQEQNFLARVLAHKVVTGKDKEVKTMLDSIVAMATGESDDIE
jgi:hypothetical protein